MPVTLEDHAPQARCYRCGSADITRLCHHCGKAMCRAHSPAVLDQARKPVSREFADLGLEPEHSGAYHCTEHEHVVKGSLKSFVIAGIALAAAGILVAFGSLAAGLVIVLAGAGLAAGAYVAGQRRTAAALAARPPLPLIPNLDSVSILETLHGQVRLSEDGTYTSEPSLIEGTADVVMTAAKSDRERLEKYRDKYGLARGEPVEFSAGFGVIGGEAGIALEPEAGQAVTPLPGGIAVAFAGNVDGHPLFQRGNGRSPGEWAIHLPYRPQGARTPAAIPIWLVPSLVPASDRRTLELDVHWVPLDDERRPGEERRSLGLDKLELIELAVPTAWGNVENVDPPALIFSPGSARTRTIQWKRLEPATHDRSQTLTIRFEKPVKKDDEHDSEQEAEQETQQHGLTGRVKASFEGTLSGVEGAAIYRPLGDPWLNSPKPSVRTEASVDFELSLSSIRYQEVRVVPDRSNEEDQARPDGENVQRPEVKEFAKVVPDYLTVIELTNEMSDDGYYVKRVIENPPRGGGRANLLNRYWDIAGRYYDGVYPIDFHVTLTGEEHYGDSIRAHGGNTAARVVVQGLYVRPEMKKQIESRWDSLYQLVGRTLESRIHAGPVPAPDRQYQATAPGPPGHGGNGQPGGRQPDPHDAAPRAGAATGQPADRAATLRTRRDAATEALLAGRISEETYQRVIADIDAEIAGI